MWIVLACIALAGCAGDHVAERPTDWPATTQQSRPWTRWWWLGSAVDSKNISDLLQQYHDAGFGGVEICPIYGARGYEDRYIKFLSPKWMEMLAWTTQEAGRLGMGVDMTTGTGWPMGGPLVPAGDWGEEFKTDLAGGSIKPTGQKVKRAAPGGEGFVVDSFSTRALDHYLARFDSAFADFHGTLPRSQFQDSYEYAGDATADLFEQFKMRRGYDALGAIGISPQRVMYDYRRTMAELHLEFVRRWVAWCHEHQMLAREQAHGAPANILDLYAAADIPETECFGEPDDGNIAMQKFASSAAHLAGKNLTSSESFTWLGEHFQVTLAQAKHETDYLFLAEVNHIFFHGMPYSPKDAPWPGWQFYAAVNFNPNGGLWRDLPALNQYIARCQSFLQAGTSDNDVLLYFPLDDLWQSEPGKLIDLKIDGEALSQTSFYAAARAMWNLGIGFDEVSDDLLQGAIVENGRIAIAHHGYRVIFVPRCKIMRPATMRKLIELTETGGEVIFQGGLPTDLPGVMKLAGDQDLAAKLADLSGSNPRIHFNDERGAMIPRTAREPMAVMHLHCVRQTWKQGWQYFVVNWGTLPVDRWVRLATPVKSAVVFDPMSGRSGVAKVQDNRVYLQLQPGESCILRTGSDAEISGEPWRYEWPAREPISVKGTWQVQFIEGGPKIPDSFDTPTLGSWTNRDDTEAKRFAGTARYSIDFTPTDADATDWVLDLGDVRESARVIVNGRAVQTLIASPFQARIGSFLKPGVNHLDIEVTNLAANRIADLDRNGVKWKIFRDINIVDKKYKPFDASAWPLRDSGLLGPVRLIPMRIGGEDVAPRL